MRRFCAATVHLQERLCVPMATLGGKKTKKQGRIWERSRKDPHLAGTTGSPLPLFTFHRYPTQAPSLRNCPQRQGLTPSPSKDRHCGKGSCDQFTADTPGCGNTLFIRSIFHFSNTVTEYHNAGYKHRMAPWVQRMSGTAVGERWGTKRSS